MITTIYTTQEDPELYTKIYQKFRQYRPASPPDSINHIDDVRTRWDATVKYGVVMDARKEIEKIDTRIEKLYKRVVKDNKRLASKYLRTPREEIEDDITIRKITMKRLRKKAEDFEKVVSVWE